MTPRLPVHTVASVDLGAESGRVVQPVPEGPAEATSLGNAAAQPVALGDLVGIADIRALIAGTTDLRVWSPRSDPRRSEATARLRDMTQDDDRQRGSSRPDQRTTWKPTGSPSWCTTGY